MTSKRNAALEALKAAAPHEATSAPLTQDTFAKPPKKVAKVMLYLPPKVARKIKEIAFTEDRKANDIYLAALDLYLRNQGHGGVKDVSER